MRYASSEITVIVDKVDSMIEITVSDDGDGFVEEELIDVSERFYKGNNGNNGNNGLGLAITKVIIEKHGGLLQISNHAQGGTQFTITIPA